MEPVVRPARPDDAAAGLLYVSAAPYYDRYAGGEERARRLLAAVYPRGGHTASWEVCRVALMDDTVAGVLADYRASCARSRTAADAHGLDDAVPHDRLGTVSLRWIYVHMIEETARHAGHADILREQTDGSTGFD
jgi:hypothetical protein